MTDTERRRVEAICEVAGVTEIDDLSDGFHTFRQLYYQRMMLFATIVKQNKEKAWKSLRHEDGELCFGGGWFIVGVDTPEGSYTYHYEDSYFSLFDCEELPRAKHWDGHTEKDVTRLMSLESEPHWIPCSERMPEEHEWIGTKKFGTTISDEVYVTFERPDGQRFTKHISFQNGELSSFDKRSMEVWYNDAKPIAWMLKPEPWEGDADV